MNKFYIRNSEEVDKQSLCIKMKSADICQILFINQELKTRHGASKPIIYNLKITWIAELK